MFEQVEKSNENKSRSVLNLVAQKKTGGKIESDNQSANDPKNVCVLPELDNINSSSPCSVKFDVVVL